MSDTSVQTAPNVPTSALTPALPKKKGKNPLVRALEGIASLKLTVVLFTLSLILVFFGTMAQVDSGIWTVVRDYFRSFYVWIPLQLMVQFGQTFFGLPATMRIPGAVPFPGGWTLGTLLLVNLVAAHLVRFKLSWKRSGILTLHAGLILMLVGELITGVYAIEGNMVIEEGETSNHLIHNRVAELAVIDPSDAKEDSVTVVPVAMLTTGGTVADDRLPFTVEVVQWMANSKMVPPEKAEGNNRATAGFGKEQVAVETAEVSGVSTKQSIETPACYVRLRGKDGADLGTYLFSTQWREQEVKVGDKTYDVALRYKQSYKPYSLTLIEFKFDRYVGTNTPKNFSSRVRLVDPEYGEDREVLIRMNEPLRHRGETFFQSSYNDKTEKGTVLQVVRNPAWQLPYWSCAIVTLGMVIHFTLALVNFLQRRAD